MKKKFYLAAAIIMLASHILPITNVFAAAPQNANNYATIQIGGNGRTSISDANGASNSVTVQYEHGTVTVAGTNLYSDNNYHVYGLGDFTITATPAANYAADLRENGNLLGATTTSYTGLAAGDHRIIDGEFELTPTTSTINYTPTGDRVDRITINDAEYDFSKSTISYPYDGTTTTVNIVLETFATVNKITALNINGARAVPTATADILNLVDGQVFRYSYNVPKADTYNISTTTERSGLVGSFLWSYKDVDKGTDDYLDHGRIELINANYDDTDYTPANIGIPGAPGYIQWDEVNTPEGVFGSAVFPAGTRLTLRLSPEVGYQLTSFQINGVDIAPQDTPMVYEFTMPAGNFHLGAKFSKVANAVDADGADAVTSGSIKLGNGEFDNGTARLDIKNAVDINPSTIEGFEENTGDYNLKTILDIKLFNTIYKGTADDTWDKQLDELNREATITLQLDEGVDGNDIIIIHEKHDAEGHITGYEVIPTTYDPVTHTLTFKTSSFSNYAIATRTVKAPNTGYGPVNEKSATEDVDPSIAIIATIALWGFFAFVAKKGLA